jgi:hypothetical protein
MSGAVDTRREMTRAEFAAAASYSYDNWWLTGEDSFIHVPSVMTVDGWNLYDHPGNRLLTEPQRVLMMWSDLVGQTSNGGFTQFVDNFESSLLLAYRLIAQLEWPDLFERFDRAFREQVGDPATLRPKPGPWSAKEDMGPDRQQMVRELARSRTRWRPWARRREAAVLELFSDMLLSGLYIDAVSKGAIPAHNTPGDEINPTQIEAAEAFDDWFYRAETKAASRIFIGDYILRHRDQLCRLTD